MPIALFVTCLAEAFAPQVADSAAELVRRSADGSAVVLVGDGCCGQPAWNAGYPAEARALARRLIPALRPYERVVVPSGSCAAMLIRYYPHLFPAGDPMAEEAAALAARSEELSAFLAARLRGPGQDDAPVPGELQTLGPVAFHASCHSLRGAGVGDAGQRCLAAAGCTPVEQANAEECCGFGGLFAAKQPELSTALADAKLNSFIAAGAGTVVAGELGCLLHLEGRARRRGMILEFLHLAEVLAGQGSAPGGGQKGGEGHA